MVAPRVCLKADRSPRSTCSKAARASIASTIDTGTPTVRNSSTKAIIVSIIARSVRLDGRAQQRVLQRELLGHLLDVALMLQEHVERR